MKYLETLELPIDQVEMSEYRLRTETEAKDMERLVRSIKEHDLIHPVAVRRNPKPAGKPHVLIAGHRRVTAHKLLGRSTIRAEVWEATDEELVHPELFEREAEAATIVSNVLQVPITLMELGRRLVKWEQEFGLTPEQMAEVIDQDVTTIHDALKLARIAEPAQKVLAARPDSVTLGQLFAFADEAKKLPETAQVKLANWLVDQERDKTAVMDHSAVKKLASAAKREAIMDTKPNRVGRPLGSKTRSDVALIRRLFKALEQGEKALEEFKALDKPRFISFTEMTRLEERATAVGLGWPKVVAELKQALAQRTEVASAAS